MKISRPFSCLIILISCYSFSCFSFPVISQIKKFFTSIKAYHYAFPLVMSEITKTEISKLVHCVNEFYHLTTLPTPEYHEVVRPNIDTLYSISFLELENVPIIMDVPDTNDRYYVIQVMDAWTNVFASIGKRNTGTARQRYVFTGPSWNGTLPADLEKNEIKSPTNFAMIVGRIQINGAEDLEYVRKLQKGLILTPLVTLDELKILEENNPNVTKSEPKKIIENMDAQTFYTIFTESLKRNPPLKDDDSMVKKLAALGIVPGETWDYSKLSWIDRIIIRSTMTIGRYYMLLYAKYSYPVFNGWTVIRSNIGQYGTNYITRAFISYFAFGANLPEDAIYPTTSGTTLYGKKKYRLHLKKEELPPVNAFWSITLYNTDGFLVENKLNRYGLGDRDALNYNQDGSLDLYFQEESPGNVKEMNWIPNGGATFTLSMRLYWPKAAAIDGSWNPPNIEEY